MDEKDLKNYAFIDSQNINLGIQKLGWKLDWKRFRVYLREKYLVKKAYLFIGYMPENRAMYTALQEMGFVLVFKPVMKDKDGKAKGNVDADLVLQAMIDLNDYEQALIVTSDGDFYCLVEYLAKKNKLRGVLSPSRARCSALLLKAAKEKIDFMDQLEGKLGYKN